MPELADVTGSLMKAVVDEVHSDTHPICVALEEQKRPTEEG